MTIFSVAWFLLILVVAGGITASIFAALREHLQRYSPFTRRLLTGLILASGLLLLRPHEDTFTGLDTSCYRLMAHAFAAGRQLHDTDPTLLELPKPLRRAVLLEYQQWGRDTRDRSFQITSLKRGSIQPYFYPFLSMAAAGLDSLTWIPSGDYFVPFIGLLLFALILTTGTALGGKYGLAASAALLIGTPLPSYVFRGYYAEAVAAALVMMVLLGLTLSVHSRLFRLLAPLALGLAVGFHPVAIILALPALILMLLDPNLRRNGRVWSLTGFGAALTPLWAMTLWGCQPYGPIADWHNFTTRLAAQPLQQLLGVFVLIFLTGALILLLGPASFRARLAGFLRRALSRPVIFMALLLLALLPLAIPPSWWSGKPLVMRGLAEYWSGVRWSYGLVLLAGVMAAIWIKDQLRSRALLLVALFLSTFFFYLKGFEQMGLWSQRRLIPLALLLIIALTPLLAAALSRLARQAGGLPATLVTLVLLGVASLNALQWPAPYLARHEQGTTAWVEAFSKTIGRRLAFFDYYPYSVPFAASGTTRVIGLSEFGYPALPALSHWLAGRARQEEVLWVSAYRNPGLEEGVILASISHERARFKRVVSKAALPAERRDFVVDVDLMIGLPITNATGVSVRKIMDDGPLALRGPWGPGQPFRHRDRLLPARWSREGSGIIGPIPDTGQGVRITLEAAASRGDGVPGQILTVRPPWAGATLELAISNDFTKAAGTLMRPAGAPAAGFTGVYTLSASAPYDPLKEGINGYPNDLGARIHLIAIEGIGVPAQTGKPGSHDPVEEK